MTTLVVTGISSDDITEERLIAALRRAPQQTIRAGSGLTGVDVYENLLLQMRLPFDEEARNVYMIPLAQLLEELARKEIISLHRNSDGITITTVSLPRSSPAAKVQPHGRGYDGRVNQPGRATYILN